MYRVRRMLARAFRYPRTCGFGVQSPFAYYFIHHVLCERTPYYAYSSLDSQGNLDAQSRRIGRLLFRLSNFVGKKLWYISPNALLSRYVPYILAGSKKSDFTSNMHVPLDALIVDASDDFDDLLCLMHVHSVCVVFNIHACHNSFSHWNRVVTMPQSGVAFDLFDLGIVFFDPSVVKQTYKVNY